jgi:hypothetical protein
MSFRIHNGRTPAGNDFGVVYQEFKERVEAPFQQFAGLCYCEPFSSLVIFLFG